MIFQRLLTKIARLLGGLAKEGRTMEFSFGLQMNLRAGTSSTQPAPADEARRRCKAA